MRKGVRERVVLKLSLGDVEVRGVRIGVTLVCVELMIRLLLILLGPTTVRGIHTSIYASRIGTNSRKTTTLFECSLTYIHSTRVTHPICLSSSVLGTETILHEFFIILGSYLNGGTIRVCAVMTMNTRGWVVGIHVLFVVAVSLKPGRVLRHRVRGYETLGTTES
jgi:hypothetical protein